MTYTFFLLTYLAFSLRRRDARTLFSLLDKNKRKVKLKRKGAADRLTLAASLDLPLFLCCLDSGKSSELGLLWTDEGGRDGGNFSLSIE